MSQNEDVFEEENLSLIEEAFSLLQDGDSDISFVDVKNLMQIAPNVKELLLKATELSHDSAQNVYDILKNVISVYEEELKRDDLTFEQRTEIYDRMDKHALSAIQQDDSNKKFIGGAISVGVIGLLGAAVKFGPKMIKGIVKK